VQSEAVEVCSDELFDLVEAGEILKDSILEYRVELVLDGRQDRSLFVLVNPQVVEVLVPVQLEEVKQLELVEHLAHPRLNFSLIKVLVQLPWLFACQFNGSWFKPRGTTFESAEVVNSFRMLTS
jgi:hypothetical protein